MSKLGPLVGANGVAPGTGRATTILRGPAARRASLRALLLGVLVVFGVGVAGAAPLGAITEFSAGLRPGANPAQVRAGSDGNLWFSDRSGAVGRITTAGTISEFTAGLNPGSAVRSIAMGQDGNMWFTDPGTTRAIGVINPTTQAISEFSTGLNAGSLPLGGRGGPGRERLVHRQRHHQGDRGDRPDHARDQRVQHRPQCRQQPAAGARGGPGRQSLVHRPGHHEGDRADQPDDARDRRVQRRSESGECSRRGDRGRHRRQPLVHRQQRHRPAIGRIDPTTGTITEFSSGLSAGASLVRIATGPDGNLWFANRGTTKSIGRINPKTQVTTEYSSGLNPGSGAGGIGPGPDGNMWFTDQGTTTAMGRIGVGEPAASIKPPGVGGTGEAGARQACDGDRWSTWAGEKPSVHAFPFDGFQWFLDGNVIAGATNRSYRPTDGDVGHELSCKETLTYTLLEVTVSATSAAVLIESRD